MGTGIAVDRPGIDNTPDEPLDCATMAIQRPSTVGIALPRPRKQEQRPILQENFESLNEAKTLNLKLLYLWRGP